LGDVGLNFVIDPKAAAPGDLHRPGFVFALLSAESHAQSAFKVTLLGTASPSPRPTRMGPSTLVEAGSQRLLFDAGRGVPVRLWQIKVPISTIDALFITPLSL
jgi:ribonuclease Z